jgi:hypothetical protein
MMREDGPPAPLHEAAKSLNREFAAIDRELQPLELLAVSHAGMRPPGTLAPPKDAAFRLDPPIADEKYEAGDRVRGVMIGGFGPKEDAAETHVLVVNLDNKAERPVTLVSTGALEVFDASTGKWSAAGSERAELRLSAGGGRLVRRKTI